MKRLALTLMRFAAVGSLLLQSVQGPALEPVQQAAGSKADAGPVPKPQPFRTADGKLGWRLKIPGGRALATPAYDANLVFVGGGYGSHEFYALKADTGEVAWRFPTGDDGPTAAIVHKGYVIFNTESCTLYVLDEKTGRQVWSKWLGDPLMNQPAAEGNSIYMAYPDSKGTHGGGHRLACFELETGKELWTAPLDTDIISVPVVAENGVYATGMDGNVYRFDKKNGRLIWKQRRNATSAPLIRGGEVYTTEGEIGHAPAGSREKPEQLEKIVSYGVRSGEIRQKEIFKQPASYLAHGNRDEDKKQAAEDAAVGFGSAPAAAKLEAAKANIAVLGSVSAGWRFQGSRGTYAEGRLYNAMGDTLTCVDPKTGKKLWEQRMQHSDRGRLLTPPAMAGERIFVGTYTGSVLGLSRKDGKKFWEVAIGEPITFQPALAKGWIYAATEQGTVVGVNLKDSSVDGWRMWGGGPGHNQ